MKPGHVYHRPYGAAGDAKTIVGTPERGEGGTWRRLDRYISPTGAEEWTNPFCAGPDDFTPAALTYNGSPYRNAGYDARCSCCYLGFPHTVGAHTAALGERRAVEKLNCCAFSDPEWERIEKEKPDGAVAPEPTQNGYELARWTLANGSHYVTLKDGTQATYDLWHAEAKALKASRGRLVSA